MEMEIDYYCYWDYYYEDYYYPDYQEDDIDYCWSYIEYPDIDYVIVDTRRGVKTFNRSRYYPYSLGRMIDMNTIYPKHILREKKINQLLGLEYHNMYKPTLAEIFPKNKDINES